MPKAAAVWMLAPRRGSRRPSYQWAQRHDAAAAPECPVCRGGIEWVFHSDAPGPYFPPACPCCCYTMWFEGRLLGIASDPGAGQALPGTGTPANGDNGAVMDNPKGTAYTP